MLPMARENHKWDINSRDARQSEFAHSGYVTTTTDPSFGGPASVRMVRKRRSRAVMALATWLLGVAVITAALYALAKYLRG